MQQFCGWGAQQMQFVHREGLWRRWWLFLLAGFDPHSGTPVRARDRANATTRLPACSLTLCFATEVALPPYRSMLRKPLRYRYWVTAVLFLGASGWCVNLATYNWFMADNHNKYSHAYALRGNVFSIVAIAFFAAFVSVIVAAFRSRKKGTCL